MPTCCSTWSIPPTPNYPEQIAQVQSVLKEIGAADIPQVLVFNKLDALEKDRWPLQLEDMFEIDGLQTPRVFVSARDGDGLAALRSRLATQIGTAPQTTDAPDEYSLENHEAAP
jgi:GTP-binding protein HflX